MKNHTVITIDRAIQSDKHGTRGTQSIINVGIEGNILNLMKGIYNKSTANMILIIARLSASPQGKEQVYPFTVFQFNFELKE